MAAPTVVDAAPGVFVPALPDVLRTLEHHGFRDPKTGKPYTLVPVYKELIADLETPVSTYLKIKSYKARPSSERAAHTADPSPQYPMACLLESVEGGERLARYSFVGFNPYRVLRVGDDASCDARGDPLVHVQAAMEEEVPLVTTVAAPAGSTTMQPAPPMAAAKLPDFFGGAIGYVGYDCARHFEPKTAPKLDAQRDMLGIPEALFMFCDQLIIFDHARHTIKVVAHARIPTGVSAPDARTDAVTAAYWKAAQAIDDVCRHLAAPAPPASQAESRYLVPPTIGSPPSMSGASPSATFDWEAASNMGRAGYEASVAFLKEHIYEGDIIQAVPSHRVQRRLPEGVVAFDVYRQLRVVNPSPYMFFLDLAPDFQIVGASPEMLVRVGADGHLQTHPIAGTRRRGATSEEDAALAAELLADEKERAEHVMLVDLGRNDLGRVAAPGTVKVDSLMHIEMYSHVMHIVSNVSARLAADKSCYDAFRAVFPAGTVSGAPKVRAIELVAACEKEKRHVYAGAVGYIGFSGVLDTAIAIRTIVIKDSIAYLQAGAGIVFDSVPAAEYEETLAKMRAVMRALEAVCGGTSGLPLLTTAR